jgi:hypothetical protein
MRPLEIGVVLSSHELKSKLREVKFTSGPSAPELLL